jgi:hypothetical protein
MREGRPPHLPPPSSFILFSLSLPFFLFLIKLTQRNEKLLITLVTAPEKILLLVHSKALQIQGYRFKKNRP